MTDAEFHDHLRAITPSEQRWLCLDPGTEKTGWVLFDPRTESVLDAGWEKNERVLDRLDMMGINDLVIMETFAAQGMPLGTSSLITVRWEGRFIERARCPLKHITRREVKLIICGTSRANDKNVKHALLDLYAPHATNHGKGTLLEPSPLRVMFPSTGASKHTFPALAVAHAWMTEHWSGR